MQITSATKVLSPTSLISLVALLQQTAAKPSKLDLQTLACLAKRLPSKKETLADKFGALLGRNKPETRPIPEAQVESGCMNYGGGGGDQLGYMVFQAQNDNTGLAEFSYLCLHTARSGWPIWKSGIKEALKNCNAPKGDLVLACAMRLLSQPSITQVSIRGLSGFIQYITPGDPVCDDEHDSTSNSRDSREKLKVA